MQKLFDVASRQRVDSFTISQTPLAGLASVNSDIVKCAGHSKVKILVRTDRAGTVRVLESVTNPTGGPTFVQTASQATAADPLTGEQVVAFDADVHGNYMRIRFTDTSGVQQTSFQISAYLLPMAGGGGSSAAVAASGTCGDVFCYLTFE